jgi:hypothetical protein
MEEVNTTILIPVAGKPGFMSYKLTTHPVFSLKLINQISHHGLPCASCTTDDFSEHQHPVLSKHYQDDKRRVVFCSTCEAIVCDYCSKIINVSRIAQETQCRWCASTLFPLVVKFIEFDEQYQPPFLHYIKADRNIADFLQEELNKVWTFDKGYDLSQIFWSTIMDTMGWKFFVEMDFLLTQQHHKQFKLLMSKMLKSFSPFRHRHLLSLVDSSYPEFTQMPQHMQFVYKQSRENAIKQTLSMVLVAILTGKRSFSICSSNLSRYLIANFAKRLTIGLTICQIEDEKSQFMND